MSQTAARPRTPATSDRIQRLQDIFGLTRGEMAAILEVSPKTLARRPLNAHEIDRLRILEQIASLAAALVPDEHLAHWFSEPKGYLDGRSPNALLASERGRRTLEAYLLGLIDSNVL